MKHDDELKETNPVKYYLNHIGNLKIMVQLKQENRELYDFIHRLDYIKSFQNTEPISRCPECNTRINQDEWGEEYCPKCGTVTRSNYPYVAGIPVEFPFGTKN